MDLDFGSIKEQLYKDNHIDNRSDDGEDKNSDDDGDE